MILRLITVCLLLPALALAGGELTFKNRGKTVKELSREQLLALVPAREITVYEPHEKREVTYRGVPFNTLLEKVYGDSWKKTEEILFTCVDGYQPSLPLSRFEGFTSYLAFERKGAKEFSLVDKLHSGETVQLGPFYLVWDNMKSDTLKRLGAEGWPYQITTVDLIRFADRFPRMAPPDGSVASVQRGFLAFRAHCMSCHRINGEGGTKGVELNYPTSVTEYFQPDWLKRWVTDAPSMRFGTAMPSFKRNEPGWSETIDDILAYLKAMAGNKKKPS
jgi:mono/diheme cytochrome c family protein